MRMTIDSLIKIFQNGGDVENNTLVYFTMHDLLFDPESELANDVDDLVFEHIPSGAKIYVENAPFSYSRCADVYIILPYTTERIWIAEDVDGLFAQAVSPAGDICTFEIPCYNIK